MTALEKELLAALQALTGVIRDLHNVYDDNGANWIMSNPTWLKAEAAIAKAVRP